MTFFIARCGIFSSSVKCSGEKSPSYRIKQYLYDQIYLIKTCEGLLAYIEFQSAFDLEGCFDVVSLKVKHRRTLLSDVYREQNLNLDARITIITSNNESAIGGDQVNGMRFSRITKRILSLMIVLDSLAKIDERLRNIRLAQLLIPLCFCRIKTTHGR